MARSGVGVEDVERVLHSGNESERESDGSEGSTVWEGCCGPFKFIYFMNRYFEDRMEKVFFLQVFL